ncbi:hypothetical protein BST61_g5644 [Cercospora zeina]
MSSGLVAPRPGHSLVRDALLSLLFSASFAQAQVPGLELGAGASVSAGVSLPPCLNAVTVTVFPPDYTGVFASLTVPGIPLTTFPPLTLQNGLPSGLPNTALSSLLSGIVPTNLPGNQFSLLLSEIGQVTLSNIGEALPVPTPSLPLDVSSLLSEIGDVVPTAIPSLSIPDLSLTTALPGALSSLLSEIGDVVPTAIPSLSIPDLSLTTALPGALSSLLSEIANATNILPPSITLPPLASGVLDIVSAVLPTSQLPTQTPVTFACPQDNGQVIVENGLPYVLNCNGASTGNVFGSRLALDSFNDCFLACDQASVTGLANFCTGFYYAGEPNGDGPGTCYLQNSVAQSFRAARGYISAARLVNYAVGGLSPIPLLDSASSILVSIPGDLALPTGLPTIAIPSLSLSLVPLPSNIQVTSLPPLPTGLFPSQLPLSDLTNLIPEVTSLPLLPTGLFPSQLPLSDLTNLIPGVTSLLGEIQSGLPLPSQLPLSDLTNLIPGVTSLLSEIQSGLPLPSQLPLSDLTNLIPEVTSLPPLPTGLLPSQLPLSDLTNLIPEVIPTNLPITTALVPPGNALSSILGGISSPLAPLPDALSSILGSLGCDVNTLLTALGLSSSDSVVSSILAGPTTDICSLLSGLPTAFPTLALPTPSIALPTTALPSLSIPSIAVSSLSLPLPTAVPSLSLPLSTGVPPLSVPSIGVPSLSVPPLSVPSLSLPSAPSLSVPSLSVPSLSLPSLSISAVPSLSIPSLSVPSLSAPSLSVPSLSLPSLSVSAVPSLSVPSLGVPSISVPSLSTSLPGNPLTNLPGLASSLPSATRTSSIPQLALPTSTGRPVFNCPADNGVSYVAPSGQAFSIQCSTNYISYDIAFSPQPNLFSCANSCSSVPGCAGVTYQAQTSLCFYKSSIGSGTPSLLADSAAPVNLDCPTGNGAQYTDFSGASYQIFCNVTFPASTNITSNVNAGAGATIGARGDSLLLRARQNAAAASGVPDIIRCSNQCSNMATCVAVTQQDDQCVFISNLGNAATGSSRADTVVLVGRQIVDDSGATSTSAVTGVPTQVSTRQASAVNNAPTTTTTTTALLPTLPTSLPPIISTATQDDCGLLGLNCGPTRSPSLVVSVTASAGVGVSANLPGTAPTSIPNPPAAITSTTRDCGLLGLNCVGGTTDGGNNTPASSTARIPASSSPTPSAASSSTTRDCGLLGLNCGGGGSAGGGTSIPPSSTAPQTVTVTPIPIPSSSMITVTTRTTSYSRLTTVLPVTTITTTSTFTYCNVGPNNFTSCTSTLVVATPTSSARSSSATSTTTSRDCGLLGLNCV